MTKEIIFKFAHCGDTHLGARPRNIRTRKLDIFDSYLSMCHSMVANEIDVMVIAGDFFHTKLVDFETIDKAENGLNILCNSDIDVCVIDGNHDSIPEYNWIRYFENYLWEPVNNQKFSPITIWSINWSTIPETIKQIEDFKKRVDPNKFNILMMHQAIEGFIYEDTKKSFITKDYLETLKPYFKYIALGHIHHSYIIDNFAFNPGSIEYLAASDSWLSPTGYFLVTVYDDLTFDYELIETKKRVNFYIKISTNDLKAIDKDEICGIIKAAVNSKQAMILVEFSGSKMLSPKLVKEIEQELYSTLNPVLLKIKNYTLPKQLELPLAMSNGDVYDLAFGDDAVVAKEISVNYKDTDRVIGLL